jgi:hypothetical protein
MKQKFVITHLRTHSYTVDRKDLTVLIDQHLTTLCFYEI